MDRPLAEHHHFAGFEQTPRGRCDPVVGPRPEALLLTALEDADHRNHAVIVRWLDHAGKRVEHHHREVVVLVADVLPAESPAPSRRWDVGERRDRGGGAGQDEGGETVAKPFAKDLADQERPA